MYLYTHIIPTKKLTVSFVERERVECLNIHNKFKYKDEYEKKGRISKKQKQGDTNCLACAAMGCDDGVCVLLKNRMHNGYTGRMRERMRERDGKEGWIGDELRREKKLVEQYV